MKNQLVISGKANSYSIVFSATSTEVVEGEEVETVAASDNRSDLTKAEMLAALQAVITTISEQDGE